MSTLKATPGPWAAFTDDSGDEPHTNIVAIGAPTELICMLPGRDKRHADVVLIRHAPRLYAALELATKLAKREAARAYGVFAQEDIEQFEAALKAARGEE